MESGGAPRPAPSGAGHVRQLGRRLVTVGPHRGAHRVAVRAGISVLVPLLLVVSVTLGVGVSLAPGSRWLVVPVGALLAAWGSLTSDAYGWHVGHLGILREPGSWVRPSLPRPQFRDALDPVGSRAHLLRYVVALSAAGALSTGLGWEHPYWAMVAAVVVLAVPDLASRLVRGLQRMVGTLLGIGIAAAVLARSHRQGVWAVVVIAALQVLAELFVGRNYALALLFVTPLALMMGQLVAPSPVGPLLGDRLLETVVGSFVAMAVLLVVPDRLPRRRTVPSAQ